MYVLRNGEIIVIITCVREKWETFHTHHSDERENAGKWEKKREKLRENVSYSLTQSSPSSESAFAV